MTRSSPRFLPHHHHHPRPVVRPPSIKTAARHDPQFVARRRRPPRRQRFEARVLMPDARLPPLNRRLIGTLAPRPTAHLQHHRMPTSVIARTRWRSPSPSSPDQQIRHSETDCCDFGGGSRPRQRVFPVHVEASCSRRRLPRL